MRICYDYQYEHIYLNGASVSRAKRIDENTILDAEEEVIRKNGAGGLTIEAVARRAGVSVGGLQYSFRSKDALIAAMFDRWGREYEADIASLYPEPIDALDEVRRDIVFDFKQSIVAKKKAASIIAALLQSPEHMTRVRNWYQSRLSGIDMTTKEGRRARVAFLAAEGAFMLRFMGLREMDESEWEDIFDDVLALLR
ncbi:TetR/AcrR family transcriptional regulator [Brucella oryzae]|uniref:TetR/AcrR family transcriptional regulator n=1 Tax=Brucella oryzae TaxID=335286 RepID=UPI001ABFC0AF|nr:TetR/AcrR family transcriptional regulator [Brucella oryzae]